VEHFGEGGLIEAFGVAPRPWPPPVPDRCRRTGFQEPPGSLAFGEISQLVGVRRGRNVGLRKSSWAWRSIMVASSASDTKGRILAPPATICAEEMTGFRR